MHLFRLLVICIRLFIVKPITFIPLKIWTLLWIAVEQAILN